MLMKSLTRYPAEPSSMTYAPVFLMNSFASSVESEKMDSPASLVVGIEVMAAVCDAVVRGVKVFLSSSFERGCDDDITPR